MKCAYPNCYHSAAFTPVIELPTMRSVGEGQAMVQTKQPTVMLCAEVCQFHKDHYNLKNWVDARDWAHIQDLAQENGYAIPAIDIITVQFRPLGWHPRGHLQLERG